MRLDSKTCALRSWFSHLEYIVWRKVSKKAIDISSMSVICYGLLHHPVFADFGGLTAHYGLES